MPSRTETHPFIDLFEAHGAIQARRMFGGFGMYVGEKIVGIIVRDRIYLKTDEESRKAFLAEKCKPFTYHRGKNSEGVSLRYYAIPERLYDEPDEFAAWVRVAEAVSRAALPKKKKSVKKKAKAKKLTKASRDRRVPGNRRRRA
jgi:DNA transformation protein